MQDDCKERFVSSFGEEEEYKRDGRSWRRVTHSQDRRTGFKAEDCCALDRSLKSAKGETHESVGIMENSYTCKFSADKRLYARKKSPLQKFDDTVNEQLNKHSITEDKLIYLSGGEKKQLGQISDNKMGLDNKVSRTLLKELDKSIADSDPSELETSIMDAIGKLAQAEMICRYDAAVKAAEEAASKAAPGFAEQVAVEVAAAKDYQFNIVEFLNDKYSVSKERKPIEVVGYIGMTKRCSKPTTK